MSKGGRELSQMAKRIRALPKHIKRNVDSNMGDLMDMIETQARANVAAQDSVVAGTLQGSINHRDAAALDTTVGSQFRGRTYSNRVVRTEAPHAPYVEYGTGMRQKGRPHPAGNFRAPSVPPTGAIAEWMRKKPVEPRTTTFYDDDEAERRHVAQLIAETIAAYGQRPHPYMRPAWESVGGRQAFRRGHRFGVRKSLKQL